jgi:hypothetical protein
MVSWHWLAIETRKNQINSYPRKRMKEDGIGGFDFLGHHIQQYPAGKYRSVKDTRLIRTIRFHNPHYTHQESL